MGEGEAKVKGTPQRCYRPSERMVESFFSVVISLGVDCVEESFQVVRRPTQRTKRILHIAASSSSSRLLCSLVRSVQLSFNDALITKRIGCYGFGWDVGRELESFSIHFQAGENSHKDEGVIAQLFDCPISLFK